MPLKLNPEQVQTALDHIREGSTLYVEAAALGVADNTLSSTLQQVLGMTRYRELMQESRDRRRG